MTPKQLLDEFGSEIKAAAFLGINPRTVKNWCGSENIPQIPYWSQCAIAHLTNNKLKVDRCFK